MYPCALVAGELLLGKAPTLHLRTNMASTSMILMCEKRIPRLRLVKNALWEGHGCISLTFYLVRDES